MLNRRIKQSTTKYIESVFSETSRKPWSFSKVLVSAILAMTLIVIIFSCIAMWYFNNIDALAFLIPAVFAECATITGFYSYKAKAENEIKLDIQRKLISSLIREDIENEEEEEGQG